MMQLLTTVQSTQPDYVALAMVLVLAILVAAMAIRKRFFSKSKPAALPAESAPAAPVQQKTTAPGAAGQVKLHNVDPKTAAMLMAIVANKMNKPLNELRFISIREAD